ncbi:diguanylate cyclase [Halomonas sp. CH40]
MDTARQQEKYQLAFEQSRDAIMLFAEDRFQDCNSATLTMFRVPDVNTFVTFHPADLSPLYQPDGRLSREAAADHLDEVMSQGCAFFEWRHRTWDGVDFPTEVLLSRIDMDNGALVQALVRDISDRKKVYPCWAAEKSANVGLNTAAKEGSWREEAAVLDREGKETPVSQVTIVHRDATGDIHQRSTFLQDISKRRNLEDQLRREKDLSESILASLPGIFYIHDGKGHLVQWNDRMETVTGRSPAELGGMDICVLVPQEERAPIGTAIAKTFSEGSAMLESKLCTVKGDTPYLLSGLRVELNGKSYLLGIGLDITRQKQLEASLEREATTDSLTGLYNRQRFDVEMERALARYARYVSETALVMIDVDHFKRVNDIYGHDIGDQVLVDLSARLARQIREADFLARWGGEEIVVLLPETNLTETVGMAERLRCCIADEPFPEVGSITISLGVTNFQRGDTPNTLLKRADRALYEAKETGRNRVLVNSKDSDA